MRIGDLVQYLGGPLMKIVGFLDDCRIAICKVLHSGCILKISISLLLTVGLAASIAKGHPPEEPPESTPVEPVRFDATIAVSGSIREGLPPGQASISQPCPRNHLDASYFSGRNPAEGVIWVSVDRAAGE
ncbi:MAG: hypothetical protein L0215_00670 [Gemmataceae bacterium]|nr:hypothetical protein [Gemmataceae bacterium]